MPLDPGHTLLNGQYCILSLLGRGGFGFVYRAQDTQLGETVAIKELIPGLVGDEETLKRFLAEARATIRLRHERIVGTHHIFPEAANYYIVMEYLLGGSLEERLRERNRLALDDALRMAADICEGLAYAHRKGIIHCDLKPANILFDASGRAKVADFGIAHVSGQMLTRSWLTPAGFVAGTLPYMSPEQVDGVRDDPRLDVYSLGAVLYRALTGATYLDFDPHETPRAQAQNVGRICDEPPLPPSRRNPEVPAWVDGVVLCALAKQPDERYASADEMRAALLGGRAAVVPAAARDTAPPSETALATRRPVPPAAPGSSVPAPHDQPGIPVLGGAAQEPGSVGRAAVSPPGSQARPTSRPTSSRRRLLVWSLAGAAGVLLLALIGGLVAMFGGGLRAGEDATPAATLVAGQLTPSLTATLVGTPAGSEPTTMPATPIPPTDTPQPTATPLLPTATSVPATATHTRTPTATPVRPTATPRPLQAGATRTRAGDGMVMVYVPAGKFAMGSTAAQVESFLAECSACQPDWMSEEVPQHTVWLDAFWIDRTEVTNAQYQRCVAAGACRVADMPSFDPQGKPAHPVVEVTWNDARSYCAWAGARLPTEAEWEKAARGTDARLYPWGNESPDCTRSNYWGKDGGCVGTTTAVGSYPSGASPYGALDMAGNALEWVADWYGQTYYATSPDRNPTGPDSGPGRVLRGGGWGRSLTGPRVAIRYYTDPTRHGNSIGFRCVVPGS